MARDSTIWGSGESFMGEVQVQTLHMLEICPNSNGSQRQWPFLRNENGRYTRFRCNFCWQPLQLLLMTKPQPLPPATTTILAKNNTGPFRNGTVFEEKRVYLMQRVCQQKRNPIGSRYHRTSCASVAVTQLKQLLLCCP